METTSSGKTIPCHKISIFGRVWASGYSHDVSRPKAVDPANTSGCGVTADKAVFIFLTSMGPSEL